MNWKLIIAIIAFLSPLGGSSSEHPKDLLPVYSGSESALSEIEQLQSKYNSDLQTSLKSACVGAIAIIFFAQLIALTRGRNLNNAIFLALLFNGLILSLDLLADGVDSTTSTLTRGLLLLSFSILLSLFSNTVLNLSKATKTLRMTNISIGIIFSILIGSILATGETENGFAQKCGAVRPHRYAHQPWQLPPSPAATQPPSASSRS